MPAGERDLQWPAPSALDRYNSCLGLTPGHHSVSPVPTNPGTRSLVTLVFATLRFFNHSLPSLLSSIGIHFVYMFVALSLSLPLSLSLCA